MVETRMLICGENAMWGKATRRKMRKAKLPAQQQNEESEPSYGKYNEADPLGQIDISSDNGNIP